MALSPIARLPNELHIMIFAHLNKSDVDACSKTCSKWKQIANDQELWQKVAAKAFTIWNIQASSSINFLRMSHQNIESNDQILSRIEEFLNKFKPGQKAKLTCFAGRGINYQTYSIEILPAKSFALGPSDWEINNSDFDVDEQYFSVNALGGENFPVSFSQPSFVFDFKRNYFYQERFIGGTLENTDIIGDYHIETHKACFKLPKELYASELRYRVHELMQAKMEQLRQASLWIKSDCAIL